MKKILFVCHGNICRSPMAACVLGYLARERGMAGRLHIGSAATSAEELGNPIYPPARRTLEKHGVPPDGHRAVQLAAADYDRYDYLIGMDSRNLANMLRILGADPQNKVCRLLDFTDRPGDIADPWYTGDFEAAFQAVWAGCEGLLAALE